MKPTTEQLEARKRIKLQGEVCRRAETQIRGWNRERISTMMDLNSLPELDLEGLLQASPSDFSHDLVGIVCHMDRSSYPGKITDCFVPRYCRK